MPRDGSPCICFLKVLINSVFGISKSYYPQVLLEECKYLTKERKTKRYFDSYYELMRKF